MNMKSRNSQASSHSCRPLCTAESRSNGLFKVLGTMVAHSICQDGIGFPYLSPTSYWYRNATDLASVEDVGANVVSKVSVYDIIENKPTRQI